MLKNRIASHSFGWLVDDPQISVRIDETQNATHHPTYQGTQDCARGPSDPKANQTADEGASGSSGDDRVQAYVVAHGGDIVVSNTTVVGAALEAGRGGAGGRWYRRLLGALGMAQA